MEYILFFFGLIAYSSLSEKIKKINNKLDNQSKTKRNLSELVGKNVVVEIDDEYELKLEGKLVSFDKKWFELKTIKTNKKNNNIETYYKRIDRIKSITIKDDE